MTMIDINPFAQSLCYDFTATKLEWPSLNQLLKALSNVMEMLLWRSWGFFPAMSEQACRPAHLGKEAIEQWRQFV